MSGNAAGDNAFVDILNGWQREVLAGGDVAEEVCAGACGDGAADGVSDTGLSSFSL